MRHPLVQRATYALSQINSANKGLCKINQFIRTAKCEPTVIIQGEVTPSKTVQQTLQMSSAFERIALAQVSCVVFK